MNCLATRTTTKIPTCDATKWERNKQEYEKWFKEIFRHIHFYFGTPSNLITPLSVFTFLHRAQCTQNSIYTFSAFHLSLPRFFTLLWKLFSIIIILYGFTILYFKTNASNTKKQKFLLKKSQQSLLYFEIWMVKISMIFLSICSHLFMLFISWKFMESALFFFSSSFSYFFEYQAESRLIHLKKFLHIFPVFHI